MFRPIRKLGALATLLSVSFATFASISANADGAIKLPATLGTNLNQPCDYGSELPFVDLIRSARAWVSQQPGAAWGRGPALAVDAQGWVTKLDPGCSYQIPFLCDFVGHVPQGQFTLLYDGKGTIDLQGSTIVSSQPGRILFTPTDDVIRWLTVSATDPSDYIRNIRLLLPGAEATYKTEPFNPTFLKRWKGVSTIRFMDWMHTNTTQVVHWSDRTKLDGVSYNADAGVPVEVMVDLCNRLGADPWFCMPTHADDDYVRQFATIVKQRLAPKRKVYIEYSNEVWNGGFPQATYAVQQGAALKLSPILWVGRDYYYSHRSQEIFKIWESVYGGHERLVRVLAWQATGAWGTENNILPYEDAYKHADAVAIAPYIGFIPKSGDPKLDANDVATWNVDKLLDTVEGAPLQDAIKAMSDTKAVCDKFGLPMIAYEGGQHLTSWGTDAAHKDAVNKLFHDANQSPRMGAIYDKYFQAWKAAGGGTFCHFTSVGMLKNWGDFAVMEYWDTDPATSPKYLALARYAASCGQTLGAGAR